MKSRVVLLCASLSLFCAWPLSATALESTGAITWGVNYSQSQAEYLGLDWRATFLAIADDLHVTHVKLITNWSWVEGKRGELYFGDIDWQMREAERRGLKVIYVLGLKTGRWPECHVPDWAKTLPKAEQQQEVLQYIAQVVSRYKTSRAIVYWQVENEPLFKFGECPSWYYENDHFLRSEVALVKALDPSRKVIISDSGERSSWRHAADIGDVVGITLYRSTGRSIFGLRTYAFLGPSFYRRKVDVINSRFGKEVICVELQAEPWVSRPLMQASLEKQVKAMSPARFEENVDFARQTGLGAFYVWGAEWWYWMKQVKGRPEIWDEAKRLFADR